MLMYPSPSYDTTSKNALDRKDQIPSSFLLHIFEFFFFFYHFHKVMKFKLFNVS